MKRKAITQITKSISRPSVEETFCSSTAVHVFDTFISTLHPPSLNLHIIPDVGLLLAAKLALSIYPMVNHFAKGWLLIKSLTSRIDYDASPFKHKFRCLHYQLAVVTWSTTHAIFFRYDVFSNSFFPDSDFIPYWFSMNRLDFFLSNQCLLMD